MGDELRLLRNVLSAVLARWSLCSTIMELGIGFRF